MAADPVLEQAVTAAVLERRSTAELALLEATEEHADVIASLPDATLAARADDVRSWPRAARIAADGGGSQAVAGENGSTFILVAQDLGRRMWPSTPSVRPGLRSPRAGRPPMRRSSLARSGSR